MKGTELSVVIPVYNEQGNVKILHNELSKVLHNIGQTYEIIFVDDASWDDTFKNLNSIKDKHLKIIRFRNNFGQSAALDVGIKNAKGKIIITMDGDLQNDPKDIPRLLAKLKKGFDVVSGWRFKRKDCISKKLTSRIAHLIRKQFFRDNLHDYGCTLKAYKREALEDVDLFGEIHRYIPVLCSMKGFKVSEIKVNHRNRIYGKTKYKYTRIINGFLDLFLIMFWMKYAKRPMHLFGGLGLLLSFVGGVVTAYLIIMRLLLKTGLADRPLFILSIMTILIGMQLFVFGILADIAIKNYYKTTGKMNYSIEKIVKK